MYQDITIKLAGFDIPRRAKQCVKKTSKTRIKNTIRKVALLGLLGCNTDVEVMADLSQSHRQRHLHRTHSTRAAARDSSPSTSSCKTEIENHWMQTPVL